MINPEIRILTGLAESHLERFGSLENIVEAKFEIAESLVDGTKIWFFLMPIILLLFKIIKNF